MCLFTRQATQLGVKHNSFMENDLYINFIAKYCNNWAPSVEKEHFADITGRRLNVLSLPVAIDSHWLLHTPGSGVMQCWQNGRGWPKILQNSVESRAEFMPFYCKFRFNVKKHTKHTTPQKPQHMWNENYNQMLNLFKEITWGKGIVSIILNLRREYTGLSATWITECQGESMIHLL